MKASIFINKNKVIKQSVNSTERVGINFIKPSADSALSFLSMRSKMKTSNWQKVFHNVFYHKLGFPNFKQR